MDKAVLLEYCVLGIDMSKTRVLSLIVKPEAKRRKVS